MAIVSQSSSTQTIDVNAIYDNSYKQIFINARPIKASIKPVAKLMKHPLEDGSTITDHIVFDPISIEMELHIFGPNFQDTYQEIYQYFIKGSTLIISTKIGDFSNQLISELPHDEIPDFYNGISINLKTETVRFASVETKIVPSNPSNKSTTDSSTVNGKTPSNAQNSSQSTALRDWIGKPTGISK